MAASTKISYWLSLGWGLVYSFFSTTTTGSGLIYSFLFSIIIGWVDYSFLGSGFWTSSTFCSTLGSTFYSTFGYTFCSGCCWFIWCFKFSVNFLMWFLHLSNACLHSSGLLFCPNNPPRRLSPSWSPGNGIFCPLISRASSWSSMMAKILIGVCLGCLILRNGWSWAEVASHLSHKSKSGQTTHLYLIPVIGLVWHSSHVTWAWTMAEDSNWGYGMVSSIFCFDSLILLSLTTYSLIFEITSGIILLSFSLIDSSIVLTCETFGASVGTTSGTSTF